MARSGLLKAILVPALLFIVLSPGFIVEIPGHHKAVEFANMRSSGSSTLVHALVFLVVNYFLLASFYGRRSLAGMTSTEVTVAVILPSVLFIVLSPGLILEIPAKHHVVDFFTGHTNLAAIFVHGLVYALVLYVLVGLGVVHVADEDYQEIA